MGEWEPAQLAVGGGLAIGVLFGAVAQATAFCSSGAVLDVVRSGDANRLRAWCLALAVAILSGQLLLGFDLVDLRKSAYLAAPLNLAGPVVGGLVFGIGMMLAQGCAARNLVRLGGGNLRALVVLLVFSVAAYATMRGILGPGRIALERISALDPGATGVPEILAAATGMAPGPARWVVALAASAILAAICFAGAGFRSSARNIVAGLSIGLLVAAGWYLTGALAQDEFNPTPPASLTFVAPMGDSLQYLMIFTGMRANFGIALVGGVVLGAFVAAVTRGRFAIEGFADDRDFLRQLAGAALMGAGGVLAMGCTVGQGLTGLSTLSLGSLLAAVSIVAGGFLGARTIERADGALPRGAAIPEHKANAS
ncbi:MAG: YeeE/YedE family protein [Alphaproteobacteria bacterium]|nr:YeeE/YedE family protein [Alphaproteobacteria bacterium]